MIIANLQNSDRYLGIHPMFKKLFVYAGNEHPHVAQKPVEMKVK